MSTSTFVHPFAPLTAREITTVASILRGAIPGTTLRFKHIEIQEPRKRDVIPLIEAERLGKPLPDGPDRLAYSYFHRMDNKVFHKAIVNLKTKTIVSLRELPPRIEGPADVDEMIEMEIVCLKHPAVQAEIAKLELPGAMTVCNDPWGYSTDDPNETRRMFQCYMYIVPTDHPQSNHYSLPAPFSPVFDASTKELIRMDYLPLGPDHKTEPTSPWRPVKAAEYAHDLIDEPLRQDLKPYIVQQPQGPSFNVDGHLINWQKWRFRLGWNYRDGIVLYNVTYDGRNVIYRLSMSEMTVPYGDPRRPYHRKQAFDVGDVGLGVTSNQLSLGCDCLGSIRYFDGFRSDSKGNPVHLKNVVCLHEQDGGILHKHTNYRNAEATVVRNRQLVVQMICTVSNYEYVFAYIFDQAGGIEFEVRATGILSTSPINNHDGQKVPWATNVGPGVAAPYHQHIFSLRVDPAIDGFENTAIYEDSVPLDPRVHGVEDPFGVGYVSKITTIEKAGHSDTSVENARVFKIQNDNIINKVSGNPVAYKIGTLASQQMLASKSSYNSKRAGFADHPVWVTRQADDELYAAGEFTMQSHESEGVEKWAARGESVRNSDLVFWHTFALTHNPRPEDFPVMPIERISVHIKPSGFFEKNPALDVPASSQLFNQSTLIHGAPSSDSCCSKL